VRANKNARRVDPAGRNLEYAFLIAHRSGFVKCRVALRAIAPFDKLRRAQRLPLSLSKDATASARVEQDKIP
jgi:hypothetical protein